MLLTPPLKSRKGGMKFNSSMSCFWVYSLTVKHLSLGLAQEILGAEPSKLIQGIPLEKEIKVMDTALCLD